MAKRIVNTTGNQLNEKQQAKLNELLSAKDAISGRLRMQVDPAYAADVRHAIAAAVGDGEHHEEVGFEDNANDRARQQIAVTGFEELQKDQAKAEVERFLQSD